MKENNNAVEIMAELMALLYYHLTKAMIEDYGEDAKNTIKKAIYNFGLERGKNIAKKALENKEELSIENLDRYYDMPISSAWKGKSEYCNGEKRGILEFCAFAKVWIEKNWREIGRLYCEVDPAIREGYNPDIQYISLKNVLDGDKCCESLTKYADKNMI
ncbi:L-2-amino-thiazoline-4-carboxylic acid hydrolase [Thermovenabulum sp.]|uniref:L-2-amino-thiazoline-4-carboxylic acid hydrolase n=1 Tax=Thermovenabulum sp. TaxID=3100335 RepID=UPI003C79EAA3